MDDSASITGDVLDGRVRRLHPQIRVVWWVSALTTSAVVGGLAAAVAGLVAARWTAAVVVFLTVFTLLVVLYAVHLPRRYENWTFRFSTDALELRNGVWWRAASGVPYHRIQQVDVTQGPIQRRLGMVELRLRTASATSDGTIPGLDADEAESLRQLLLARAERDDGT
jgi:uncharacterized protein